MELLERESPLEELRSMLREVEQEGRVALVYGEAGIGKTSLITHFIKERGASLRILQGGCDSLFTPRPLGPLYDIVPQIGGELQSLLNADAQRQVIFSEVLSELKKHPSILIIEDIHWADEATLDLIKYLGRRIRQAHTLIILTYRDDEVTMNRPLQILLGDIVTSNLVRRISLSPLSENAVRLLMSGLKDLDPVAIHRLTNGNPFFVTEVLAGGGASSSSVRDAVLARAARLSTSGRAVLEAAAVIGLRQETWLLMEAVESHERSIEECVATGMLYTHGDGFAFRHELTRQTVLENTSPQRRLMLHKLVLAALKKSPRTRTDLSRLASHAEGAQDAEEVLIYAPAAARKARAVHAHHQAAANYALALDYADALPAAERALLLEEYALECNVIDRRPEGIVARRSAIEIWRSLGNVLKQGENLSQMVSMHFGLGQAEEAERSINTSIELLESLPPSRELAQAYRMRASLCMLNRDIDPAISWSQKAIELAKRFDDSETLSAAYNAIGSSWMVMDFERGQQYLEMSLQIARQARLEFNIANTFTNLGSAAGEVYHYTEAERYLTEGIAYCIERDFDVARLYMRSWLSLTYLYLGRWDEAGEISNMVLQQSNASSITRIMALLALGRLRARRGDPGAWEALDEAIELAEKTQTLQRIAPVRAARAEAAYLMGDRERCLKEAQSGYFLAESKKHPWFVGELAFWIYKAGEKVTPPAWAAKPFALSIAGAWNEAADVWRQLACPFEQAFSLVDGDSNAQSDALEIFERLGAHPAAEMVRGNLNALSPRQIAREKFGGLSVREREVAILIAYGKSNREIAEHMTVGIKTVETYVTRILNKLGFDSRVQIATWAVAKGLSAPSNESGAHK